MKKLDDVRQFILQESERRSEGGKGTLAEWSRQLGKNHAYLHQFIHRQTPRKLDETTRHDLAKIMNVHESKLGGQKRTQTENDSNTCAINEIDARAGMGGGGTTDGHEVVHDGIFSDPIKNEQWRIPARFIRDEIRSTPSALVIIETQGDSMSPTLNAGDRVFIDTGHRIPSPDGVYALRDQWGFIVVKRLQVVKQGEPTPDQGNQ